MLPPESTQAIFLPLTSTLLLRTAASGVAPVSYTHLDVYKRQGYYVDTVGKNTKAIDAYISNQLKEDRLCLLYTSRCV